MAIRCHRCGSRLTRINTGGGAVSFGGTLPVLYNGVICGNCGKLECSKCKKSRGRLDAPCSWCSGPVSPAYENLLGGAASGSGAFARSILKKLVFPVIFLAAAAGGISVCVNTANRNRDRSLYEKTIASMNALERAMAVLRDAKPDDPADPLPWQKGGSRLSVKDFGQLCSILTKTGLEKTYPVKEQDAWGRRFVLERWGDGVILISYGSNGRKDFRDPSRDPALPMSKGGDLVTFDGKLIHAPREFLR